MRRFVSACTWLSITSGLIGTGLIGAGPLGAAAYADDPVTPSDPGHETMLHLDSGLVRSGGRLEDAALVYTTTVSVPGASWLRLWFGDVLLAGDPAAEGAVIRITSVADGGTQWLNAESLRQWSYSSAYFNGDTVIVDVLAHGGTGDSRMVIRSVSAGAPAYGDRSICDGADNRVLSSEPANARFLPSGCTAWLFNDPNRTFLSAGHCNVSSTGVAQFNVPLSTATGVKVNPPPEHQYAVESTSIQQLAGGIGNDWAYFGTFPNSNTGLTAFQAQGQAYPIAQVAPPVSGQSIRITGYGTTSSPVSPTWNQVQKTHTGPYFSLSSTTVRYRTDTTGGNSGSPIVVAETGVAIGIHTNGGCSSTGGSNSGCAIHAPALQTALNNPRGICRPGNGPAGSLFVSSDLNNNLGTIATAGGGFRTLAQVGPFMQGLAYDRNEARLLGIDSQRRLYSLTTTEGATSLLGTVTGTSLTLTGLAFDPNTSTLYSIAQSNGQLFRINLATLVASPIGPAQGGIVGGLDFDRATGTLYGVDDSPAPRIVRISTTDGARTQVGAITGATDCNGLAFSAETRLLYTINAPTGQVIAINPETGVATAVGAAGVNFGSLFGMASLDSAPCSADFDRDGDAGTDADIAAFFACLAGACCPTCGSPDMDGDGDAGTDADIEAFFRVIGGGNC